MPGSLYVEVGETIEIEPDIELRSKLLDNLLDDAVSEILKFCYSVDTQNILLESESILDSNSNSIEYLAVNTGTVNVYYGSDIFQDMFGHTKVLCGITPESVTLPEQIDLFINQSSTKLLQPDIFPTNSTNYSISWETTDKTVADVDSAGYVVATGDGECEIICKVKSKNQQVDRKFESRVKVTVKTAPSLIIAPDIDVYIGVPRYSYVDADPLLPSAGCTFEYFVDNEEIATIDPYGLITGHTPGTTKATVVNEFGLKAEFVITVCEEVILPNSNKKKNNKVQLTDGKLEVVNSSEIPTPKLTDTIDVRGVYDILEYSERTSLGTIRVPRTGTVLEVIYNGGQAAVDAEKTAYADPEFGVPGELLKVVHVADHNYQEGKTLAEKLRIGDKIIFETFYGTYEYRYADYSIADKCFNSKYVTNDGKFADGSLFGIKAIPSKENHGELYFRTCYPLNMDSTTQFLFMKFYLISGEELR